MASFWTKGCAALALIGLSVPVLAAGPANSVRSSASKAIPATNRAAHSHFELTAGTAAAAPVVRSRTPARAQRARTAQFGNGDTAAIEGPSWSYQTSRRGPVFEMGALGGGAMQDAPFLAHVALAWQF